VLGDKYRVAAKRRLLAIVTWLGRSQAVGYQLAGVLPDHLGAFLRPDRPLLRAQSKRGPEF